MALIALCATCPSLSCRCPYGFLLCAAMGWSLAKRFPLRDTEIVHFFLNVRCAAVLTVPGRRSCGYVTDAQTVPVSGLSKLKLLMALRATYRVSATYRLYFPWATSGSRSTRTTWIAQDADPESGDSLPEQSRLQVADSKRGS